MAGVAQHAWMAEQPIGIAAHIHRVRTGLAIMRAGPHRPSVLDMAVRASRMGDDFVHFLPRFQAGFDRRVARACVVNRLPRRRRLRVRNAHRKQACGQDGEKMRFGHGGCSRDLLRHANRAACLSGSDRARSPVSAKSAFAKAGATGGRPGSPTPLMCSPFSRIATWTIGV